MASDSTLVESKSSRSWLVMVSVGVGSLLGSIDSTVVNIALPTIRRSFGTDVATAEWVMAIYLLIDLRVPADLRQDRRLARPETGLCVWLCDVCRKFSLVRNGAQHRDADPLPCCAGDGRRHDLLERVGDPYPNLSSFATRKGTWPASPHGLPGLHDRTHAGRMADGPVHLAGDFLYQCAHRAHSPGSELKFIPWVRPANKSERFDFSGAALFLATFSLLLIALNQGHTYGWTSSYILRMFAAAILLLAVFVLVESRIGSPLLDLSLFRVPTFSLSAASAICNYMAMFSITFLMPFYLIQGRGLSSSSAGMLMTVQPLVMVIFAPLAGAISDRVGTRWPAMLGMALLALAMFLLSRLGPTTSLAYIGTAIGMAGLGMGIFVAPNNSTMMGSAPKNRVGIAAGVLATARYIGMIFGVGVSGAIFTTFIRAHTQAAFYQRNPDQLPRRLRSQLHWVHHFGRPQMKFELKPRADS